MNTNRNTKFVFLLTCLHVLSALGQQQQHAPINYNILVQALQQGVDQLGEKLKSDLNEKYLQLSNQLDDNDRRVGKTLSLFEREWREKTDRLTKLEERQFQVETSIVKITNLLNELNTAAKRLPEIEPTPTPVTTVTQGPQILRPVTVVPRIPIPRSYKPIRIEQNITRNELKHQLIKQTPINYNTVNIPASIPAPPVTIRTTTEYLNLGEVESSYHLTGSASDFKTLETIPISSQIELTTIELQYVHVDPEVLIQSLENCTKLRSLKLIQVNLTKEFEPENRVVLPVLEEFVLDQIGVLQFRNDTIFSKWTEIDEYLKGLDKDTLKSFIFFDKNSIQSWNISKISGLGTNIQLLIDGVKIFCIDYEAGEINSMLKYSSDFIENLDYGFVLKKLAVSVWKMDLGSFPVSIRSLNLNYVLDNHERDFGRKLEKLYSLQDLNIFIGNQGNLGWRLSSLPLALKNLTIRYSDIRNFPKDRLLRLDNLYLHLCQFDQYFVEDFPYLFEAVNVAVMFRREQNLTGLHHFLLHSILQTPVSRILMLNFDRRQLQPLSVPVFENMEYFLELCGIPRNSESFLLELIDEEWHGRPVGRDEQVWRTFSLVGTDKFVTFDTYRKIVA